MSCPFTTVTRKLEAYAELVKFEHTIFALPFALSALILAAPYQQWPALSTVGWVLMAMVGGRTYAMGLNRILDCDLDAKNPRTASRAMPQGRVKKLEAIFLTFFSAVVLLVATWQLPPLCLQLLPVAFLILTVYSWMKRFSNLCHLVLGIALGSSAIGGWLALTGEWSGGLPLLFGLAVSTWVAGFDIIYACQDWAFDREAGLHSIPVSVGIGNALQISRFCHGLTVLFLVVFGGWYSFQHYPIGLGFWIGTALTAAMLLYEHRLVSANDLSKVNEAFFTVNGRISLTLFGLILLDKAVQIFAG